MKQKSRSPGRRNDPSIPDEPFASLDAQTPYSGARSAAHLSAIETVIWLRLTHERSAVPARGHERRLIDQEITAVWPRPSTMKTARPDLASCIDNLEPAKHDVVQALDRGRP